MLIESYLKKQIQSRPAFFGALIQPRSLLRLASLDTLVCTSAALFQVEQPRVSRYFAMQDQLASTKERYLQIAGSLAGVSKHPLLKAVRRAASETELSLREVEVETARKDEVTARLDRTWYVLGGEEVMKREGIELGVSSRTLMEQLELEGNRMLFLAQKQPKRLLAVFACLSDLQPDAADMVKQLAGLGVRIILLTEERTRVAKGIAAQLGFHLVHSELSTAEKQEIISLLEVQNPRAGFAATRAGGDLVRETGLPILVGQGLPRGREVVLPSLRELPVLLEESRHLAQKTQKLFFWCKLTVEPGR